MSNKTITITQKGDFKKVNSFLERCLEVAKFGFLDKYGRKGVDVLSRATPKDTGRAATSWSYQIQRNDGEVILEWHNNDIENGFPVVIGIQYGHATKNGSWVEGIDFINPSLRPIFEEIKNDVLKEVKKH